MGKLITGLRPDSLGALLVACALVAVAVVAIDSLGVDPPIRAVSAPPAVAAEPGAGEPQETPRFEDMTAWNLFGAAAAKPVDAPPPALSEDLLPDTSLELTLTGIISSGDDRNARAIVYPAGDVQRDYHVGDQLPGGAIIDAIHERSVILLHRGQREVLRLRDPEQAGAASTPAVSAAPLPGVSANPPTSRAARRLEAIARRAGRNE